VKKCTFDIDKCKCARYNRGVDWREEMLEAIGKELKVIRIRNDLSLDDVAHDININRETLRRYENNSNGLSVERLEELLNYYNIEKSIFFSNVCEYMHEKSN